MIRLSLLPIAVVICAIPAVQPPGPVTDRATGFVADVDQLRAVLEEGHAALYRYRSRQEIDSAFAALRDSAQRTTAPVHFWREVNRTLAFIRDAHLTALPGGALWGRVFGHRLPFTMRVSGHRLYVLVNSSAEGGPPPGSEIQSINGRTASALIDECTGLIAADGRAGTRVYRRMEREFEISCGVALELRPPFVVTYTPRGGSATRTDTVTRKRAEAARTGASPGALTFPGARTAVLSLRTFSASGDFSVTKFLDRSFKQIADSGVRSLIIDLRENGGGRDGLGAALFSHVARDTFSYGRRVILRRKFSFADRAFNWQIKFFISTKTLPDGRLAIAEALDKVQHPVRNAFAGRVIVLADRSTFSTSAEVVALMQEYKRATFIGEELPSAREGGSGATRSVMLRHSQFIVSVPLVKYELPYRDRTDDGRGVMPDVMIEPTIDDLIAGRDVIMEAALEFARQQ
jgi:hypothetical protein